MRWLDDVSTDRRKMGITEWRDRARDQEAWRRIVKGAKAHPGGCSAIKEEEYVLHWPDDGCFTAETCSPDVNDISSLC